jgi:prepilin-type N-terminal cleavage/methylation domain-containing protein
MESSKGFTLIQLLVVVAILCILIVVPIKVLNKNGHVKPDVPTQCVSGYTFVEGKQLISSTGTGIPCTNGSFN